jgi:hypothetical protein
LSKNGESSLGKKKHWFENVGKRGDHPYEDLAKSGYKPYIKCKFQSSFYIFCYTLKIKSRNLVIFTSFFPSQILVIENLQNNFIFKFLISFLAIFRQ